MRHADRVGEELGQVGLGVGAGVAAHEGQHIDLALADLGLKFTVVDHVEMAAAQPPLDAIGAFVVAADKSDGDAAGAGALAQEVRSLVAEKVEEGETDGFQNRALARAVVPDDRVDAGAERNPRLGIALDVFQLDFKNLHASVPPLAQFLGPHCCHRRDCRLSLAWPGCCANWCASSSTMAVGAAPCSASCFKARAVSAQRSFWLA